MAAGVVVLDLVVVPGGDERVAGVGGLEVGVGLVLGVPEPVVGAGRPARRRRGGGAGCAGRVLVDVVAQVQDQVEVLLGQVPVGGVVALLEVLAGDEGQVQATEGAPRVGAVRVRPIRLRWPPARKRYQ